MSPFIEGGKGDVLAQSGQKFSTGLNNLGGTDALGSSNNFPLIIKTNGTEKMRVTETGNVGIGISAPIDKLQVAGKVSAIHFKADSLMQAWDMKAASAEFATALITGNLNVNGQITAGSLTVSGSTQLADVSASNATVSGQLSVSNITSPSGNISLGNNDLSTTGNINSANISSLQSQVDSIQQSQWVTLDSGTISYSGDVFVNRLNAQSSISIGAFRFSNGATPAPIKRDSIYAPNKLVIGSQEKAMELAADTVTMRERLGIGKTPTVALDVVGDIAASGTVTASGLHVSGQVNLDSVHIASNIQIGNSTIMINGVTNEIYTKPVVPYDLFIQSTLSTNNTIINPYNGNVGIGTTTPQAKLEISQANPYTPALLVKKDIIDPVLQMVVLNNTAFEVQNTALGNYNKTLFVVKDSGKVGIGTNVPAEQLQVNNGNILIKGINNFSTVGDDAVLLLGDNNHYIKSVFGGGIRIGTYGAPDAIMLMQSNGNVGIGTTNPQEKLHVDGRMIVAGSDFILGINDGRNQGTKPGNRALVHDGWQTGLDNLVINFDGDFEDGVFVGGPHLSVDGKVYINTTPTNVTNATGTHYELNVCGTIQSKEWIVQTGWCDFALKPGYKKMNWRDKRNFYLFYGYLPYMDSGEEIEKNGLHSRNLKGMMWNIEENRLDIDELYEKVEQLKKESKAKEEKIELLEKRIEKLEKKLERK